METGIGWLGVVVGFIGWIATGLMAGLRGGPDGVEKRTRLMGAGLMFVLTVVFWAVSMQTREPFSTGQTLGFGFLIGGLSGMLAGLLNLKLPTIEAPERSRRLSVLSMAFFALLSVSLTYTIFHTNPRWALMGYSIGAVMAGIISVLLTSPGSLSSTYSEVWAGFGVTISAGIILAIEHFNLVTLRTWWPTPILIAVTVLAASYAAIEVGSLSRDRWKYVLSTFVSALLVVGLSAVYSWKIVKTWQLLEVTAAGTVVAMVIAWISSISPGDRAGRMNASAFSVLLIVAFIVAVFKFWAGLGIALGLLAFWSIALPALGSSMREDSAVPEALGGALSMGLVILLFRTFVQYYQSDLRMADLQVHYTFIGALLGMLLPVMGISSLLRIEDSQGARRLAGILAIGLLAAALPILLYLVWQAKAVLGFTFGLAAVSAFLLVLRLSGEEGALSKGHSIGLLAVGAELMAIQFIRPLMDIELSRSTRICVLFSVVIVAVIWSSVNGILLSRRSGGR